MQRGKGHAVMNCINAALCEVGLCAQGLQNSSNTSCSGQETVHPDVMCCCGQSTAHETETSKANQVMGTRDCSHRMFRNCMECISGIDAFTQCQARLTAFRRHRSSCVCVVCAEVVASLGRATACIACGWDMQIRCTHG